MGMGKFIVKRLGQTAVTLYIIMTLLFVLFRIAPGDPAAMILDPTATPEVQALIRGQFGLNDSIWVQYWKYLWNLLQGKFGNSFYYGTPVFQIIWDRLPNTVLLFTSATILSAIAGIAWGKVIAWRRGSTLESFATFIGLAFYTVFLPWFAIIMIWIFGYRFGWFPLNGMLTPELWLDPRATFLAKALDVLHHLMLPLLVLFIHSFAGSMLLMRSSMLDTLREDYIMTARAKGLADKVIRNRHAARNAMLPVVTSVALGLAFSINGGALTETVFSWPGLGQELVSSVSNYDYPLAQAAFLFIATFVLLANLIADVLYAYLDPRIKY
ncbi:MAG: ABC transporter permease [Candidatus Tectomicrobia bacterium]|nr:ABC transporter permease [Candidatus Tectomicrobia bacterium]